MIGTFDLSNTVVKSRPNKRISGVARGPKSPACWRAIDSAGLEAAIDDDILRLRAADQ